MPARALHAGADHGIWGGSTETESRNVQRLPPAPISHQQRRAEICELRCTSLTRARAAVGAGCHAVAMTAIYPHIVQVVLDTTDGRRLAEFYRGLLGLAYRPGDEPPSEGEPDDKNWLTLRNPDGWQLAFQQTDGVRPSTWPGGDVPQMFHLDTAVANRDELERQRERALALGATQILDETDNEEGPLYVFADPSGHPLCIFVEP